VALPAEVTRAIGRLPLRDQLRVPVDGLRGAGEVSALRVATARRAAGCLMFTLLLRLNSTPRMGSEAWVRFYFSIFAGGRDHETVSSTTDQGGAT
jgi:hypothetical protein